MRQAENVAKVLKLCQASKLNKMSEPNTNLCLVEKIEGLISQAAEIVNQIEPRPSHLKAARLKKQVQEDIHMLQKIELFELRKAFE